MKVVVNHNTFVFPLPLLKSSPTHPWVSRSKNGRIKAEIEIRICVNRSCRRQGSRETLEILSGLCPPHVSVNSCGCLGRCGAGPNLVVLPDGVFFGHCGTPARAAELLGRSLCGYSDSESDPSRSLVALSLRKRAEEELQKSNFSEAQLLLSQTCLSLVEKYRSSNEEQRKKKIVGLSGFLNQKIEKQMTDMSKKKQMKEEVDSGHGSIEGLGFDQLQQVLNQVESARMGVEDQVQLLEMTKNSKEEEVLMFDNARKEQIQENQKLSNNRFSRRRRRVEEEVFRRKRVLLPTDLFQDSIWFSLEKRNEQESSQNDEGDFEFQEAELIESEEDNSVKEIGSSCAKFDKPMWKEVQVTGIAKGKNSGGAKNWRCPHCSKEWTSTYTRVYAHFFGAPPCQPNKRIDISRCTVLLKNRKLLLEIRKRVEIAEKQGLFLDLKRSSLTVDSHSLKKKGVLEDVFKQQERSEVDAKILRALYACGIPFNVLKSPYFHEMVSSINSGPKGYKCPSFEKSKDEATRSEAVGMEISPGEEPEVQGGGQPSSSLGPSPVLPEAIDLKPFGGLHIIHRNRSAARLAMGNLSGALEDAKEALTIAPQYPQAYICQGDAFLAMDELDAAEKSYTMALQIDPSIRRFQIF
ncbi:hypothetical protein HHK36_030264 [Tetracentron sinense]|uniref:Uncharacterized protein n=1 Tax=Tetracentron sinense TaxID=13715 RepID=A0A834YH18_TETSI|nr:hypothetical protein HHK36_030264 [Tetracentron sinense]